jgi:hypothetical protein
MIRAVAALQVEFHFCSKDLLLPHLVCFSPFCESLENERFTLSFLLLWLKTSTSVDVHLTSGRPLRKRRLHLNHDTGGRCHDLSAKSTRHYHYESQNRMQESTATFCTTLICTLVLTCKRIKECKI